ncbi:sulfatase domain-containing protein [Ditylenchus destructor]|uniref:Sulfatase domain-containing protein n=1 Tax=Ditylenchus destructor TaxID=166010 RepID=A0AAD4QXD9_9BILA|nr:sulfatase domain-containing protein [Ditylenchus destructor]
MVLLDDTGVCRILLMWLIGLACNSIFAMKLQGGMRPNIILFITDDQDVELGSMEFMPWTLRLLRQRGMEFKNAFATTPICCPSRSSILSGLYVHNHNVLTNNANCTGREWRDLHEKKTFAVHLKELANYRTGYFGKYLNEYDGSYIPPGWDEWLGLVKNSRFYNYTVNHNGNKIRHGSDYEKDYFTDLIANETLKFIDSSILSHPQQPFLAVLSFPAPHGPEDPAPQFSNLYENVDTHRTPSWNFAPNPDKQWLLQHTGKMEPVHVVFTDLLHRRRLQTLQSVDDAVHRVLSLLRSINELHNTYVIFTSDHGYHLGQFGLVKGKNMPYEFDIKVPFFIRGPGVPRGKSSNSIVANIDIAPTILAMAGLNDNGSNDKSTKMDGRSIVDLIELENADANRINSNLLPTKDPWRHTLLIERGKMPKLRRIGDRIRNQMERYNKLMRINRECSKIKFQAPCKVGQHWKCVRNEIGQWRIHKCRAPETVNLLQDIIYDTHKCLCGSEKSNSRSRMTRSTHQNPGIVEEYDAASSSNSDSILEDNEMINPEILDEWETEFLNQAQQQAILDSGEWYQGIFDTPLSSGTEQNTTRTPPRNKRRILPSDPINVEQWARQKVKVDSKIKQLTKRKANGNADILPFVYGSGNEGSPPLWPVEFGDFCFCQNSNNNTYWCLRTINTTHNFLYCEFITEFVSFYDLNNDPYQLRNIVYQLDLPVLEQLSAQLRGLKSCQTRAECEHYGSSVWFTPFQR